MFMSNNFIFGKNATMSREQILETIRTSLESNLQEINTSLGTYRTSTNIDESDTKDPEDFSQQSESRDMEILMEQQLDNATAQLSRLNALASRTSDAADAGSIVESDDQIFFLGVSFPTIKNDQKEIIGISSDSPAFQAVRGKGVGDSFQLGQNQFTITAIY